MRYICTYVRKRHPALVKWMYSEGVPGPPLGPKVKKRYRTHFPNASRDGREYYIRVTPVCVGGGRETENECIIMIVK